MNLTIGLGLAAFIIVALGIGVWLIRRAGKSAAEGEQAKAAIDTAKRIQKVPQPLPGEAEEALRKGRF